jgi:hypothetical protein
VRVSGVDAGGELLVSYVECGPRISGEGVLAKVGEDVHRLADDAAGLRQRGPVAVDTVLDANSSASWRSTRTAIGSATSAARRALLSDWPNSSAEGRRR